ncbi:21021_t:CDS:2 [Rhizophagus irregularis]|nr:21021_t:CDS:2 [Rhizophagus irregularis]
MKIYDAILDWVLFNNDKTENNEEIKSFPSKKDQIFSIMLSKEMLKMFLNNSPLLEYLKIDISRELRRRTRCEFISFSSSLNISLNRLNTLHCSNDNANNEILKVIAQSTTTIKNIIIFENDDWNNDNVGIVNSTISKLIKTQQGIERVTINQVSKGITEILSSLKSQKNTLKEIHFNHVSFGKDENALKYISDFSENLKELRFRNCYNLTNNVMKELLSIEFPKLISLEINNDDYFSNTENYPTKEILELIKNLGNNLSELILNTSSLSNSIFHHIKNYCNNLTTLGLDIGYNQLLLLFELFKSLNKLERFIVQSDGGSIHIDNWLKKIPQSITSLEVNGWIISPNGLNDFLNINRNKINILSWRLPTNVNFNDYSNIIDNYIIKNNLYFVKSLQNHYQKGQYWDEATPFLIGVGIGTAGRFSIKATQKYKPSRTIRSVYYKGGFDNEMNKREAALILGLKERDINRAKIKEAYRKTLMLNHPDKGGSPYLASKIIEAKNFLEKVVRK